MPGAISDVMPSMMKVTILGCGSSNGVPSIVGNWGDCDPENPKNHRRRPSILVDWDDSMILVDTSPDLRVQLLDAGVRRIDAVLYTHVHADHVHGIDDLRSVHRLTGKRIEAFGEAPVIDAVVRRFGYLFQGAQPDDAMYRPIFTPRPVDGRFEFAGHEITPFPQDHGICPSTGFRFGRFAYSTDVVRLGAAAFAALEGVDTWVVDCLRAAPEHPTHAHLARTLEWIDRVRPRRAVLTHMNHQTDFATIAALLPDGVEPAYDGMVLDIPT
jgi:phosphoribosyl 1,2-cyclic phosphate phosphodiesterase